MNPRIDIVFKKLFGVDKNKDLLISLINSIVTEKDQVAQVTICNPYTSKNFKKDKQSVLDIRAISSAGVHYNIEIQVADEKDYDKRALFYWGKLYTEQLQETDPYAKLNKTIGIHILNFTSITGEPKYHNIFQLREVDSHLHYFENMELHTIELNKFWNQEPAHQDRATELELLFSKAKKSLDVWVAFLTRHDLLSQKNLPAPLNDPCLKKALHVLETMNFTKKEREEYEAKLNWWRIETSALDKKGEVSFQLGIEQGRQERQEEITKAQEERRRLIQGMLQKGLDISIIMECTGLTEEALNDLRKGDS